MSSVRKLDPWEAFVLSFAGLGYLYVGRLRTAIAVIIAGLAVVAALGWTRWIFEPLGVWLLIGALTIVLFLHFFHPALIARKEKVAPARAYNRWFFYVGWVVALSLLGELYVLYRVQLFGFDIYRIPSPAMAPTLQPGDWVTADSWWYENHEPRVGDIVAFGDGEGRVFAKRIVGVPGEVLEIRGGDLYRNGQPAHEPYLHTPLSEQSILRDVASIKLGSREYYVLGDFRDNSSDSRVFGPIVREQLIARVWTIGFSLLEGRVDWDRFPRNLADDT